MATNDANALISEAWQQILSLRGVRHLNPSDLDCHPLDTCIVVGNNARISLKVCVTCLSAYLNTSDGSTFSHVLDVDQRRCTQCGMVGHINDFMSRNGFPVKFCSACRRDWAKKKKEAEGQAADEHVRSNLATMRADLERLERELSQ